MDTVSKRSTIWTHFYLSIVGILMVYPVVWWLGASLKTNAEMSSPNIFPSIPQWSNFTDGWVAIPNFTFTTFYMNSFVMMFWVVITTVVSCSLVAFAFGKLDFPLKNFWFALLLLTLMLPSQVTLVPQYSMFNAMGWVNTYLPFYIPHLLAGGVGGSFFVFLLIQFIRGLPKDLDEAAKIDGCSWWGIYWRIVLPLTKPSLVTVAIYCFLWNWDDFMGHLIYINSVEKYTVGLALRLFVDTQAAVPWGQLMAMSLASIIPSILIFFFAQKHFVEGIATTGLKG